MRSIFKIAMMFVLAVSMSGCATLPTNLVERSAKFVKGKSTYAEVIAELGAPQGSGDIDGKKRIAYIDGYYGGNRVNMEFDEKGMLITKMTFTF